MITFDRSIGLANFLHNIVAMYICNRLLCVSNSIQWQFADVLSTPKHVPKTPKSALSPVFFYSLITMLFNRKHSNQSSDLIIQYLKWTTMNMVIYQIKVDCNWDQLGITAAKTHLIRVRAAVKKCLSITVKEKLDYQARYDQKLTSGRYANGLGISVNTFNDAVRKAKSEIRGDTPQTTGIAGSSYSLNRKRTCWALT